MSEYTPPSPERMAEIVARERAEQGLPPTIEDPATLAEIAEVFRTARRCRLAAQDQPSEVPSDRPSEARSA